VPSTAQDKCGQKAQASTVVNVTRNQKLGVLSLNFNDLTMPIAGLPIEIVRSYRQERGIQLQPNLEPGDGH